jgi:hypothetical protein
MMNNFMLGVAVGFALTIAGIMLGVIRVIN